MKVTNVKNTLIAMLFLMGIGFVSCEETEDPAVQPTLSIAGQLPSEVGIGSSVDIQFTIGPDDVQVLSFAVNEKIVGADGVEKSNGALQINGSPAAGGNTFTYQAGNAVLQRGDKITLTMTVTGEDDLFETATAEFTATCGVMIGGDYLATTVSSSAFDGDYDNTGTPFAVTVTDNGDGTYTFSDVTGGLYGDFYAGIVNSNDDCDDIGGLSATLVRDGGCGLTIGAVVPDHPGFVCRFGDNDMTVTGTIDENGVITLQFVNPVNDNGTVTLNPVN